MKLSLFIIIFISNLALATDFFQGSEGGGGGDNDELRVNSIRKDLLNWIQDGHAKKLILPYNLDLKTYEDKMKKFLTKHFVEIVFVLKDHPTNDELQVKVDGQPKTCKSFFSKNKRKPTILCNIERFNLKSEDRQYRIIHHEFAGLANLEKNIGSQSDYIISDQISTLLEPRPVLRLTIKNNLIILLNP